MRGGRGNRLKKRTRTDSQALVPADSRRDLGTLIKQIQDACDDVRLLGF